MSAAFTVLLPHKRNPGNDAALRVALDCLFTNTVSDFALIVDACVNEPLYPRVNRMARRALTDCLVYWSSDLFAALGWDVPMLMLWDAETLVTNVVVEPRMIAMHAENYERDFGRKPETFQRDAFEAWAASSEAHVPNGVGWGTPWMASRESFLSLGGLQESGLAPDHQGFTSADTLFFDRWLDQGWHMQRARSFVYHLQRFSELDEQTAEKRGS